MATLITAAEIATILADGRIRDKGRHIRAQFAQRDLALQEAGEIARLLLPVVLEMRKEIAAMARRRTQGAAYRRRVQAYIHLRAIQNGLHLRSGGGSEGLLEVNEDMLALAREIEDGAIEAQALGNQAVILMRMGESVRGLERQREAIAVRRRHGLPETENVISLNHAAQTLLTHLSDPEAALEASDEAMAIIAKEPVPDYGLCGALEIRGMILYRLGRVEEAMRTLITAQQKSLECEHVDLAVSVTITLVDAFYYNDDYTAALEYARNVETLDLAPRRKASLWLAVVRVLIKLDERDLVREKLRQVEELLDGIHAPMLHFQCAERWGMLHLAEGDARAAEQAACNALVAAEREHLSVDYHLAAMVQQGDACAIEGRTAEAESIYREVERRAEGGVQRYYHTLACLRLGQLYDRMGRTEEAEMLYRRIVELRTGFTVHEMMLSVTERLAAIAREREDYRNADFWFRQYHDAGRALDQKRHNDQVISLRLRYRIDLLEAAAACEREERERAHSALNSTQTDLAALQVELAEFQNRVAALRSRIQDVGRRIKTEGNNEAMASLHSLMREVERSSLVDRAQWQTGLHRANEEFSARLRARHPALTPALITLCECVRSGLTNDTLAEVLHLSAAAVSKRRHRLRKLLGLRDDQKLETYLAEV